MKDIENREDIVVLVDAFYGKIREDDLLGPVFNSKIPPDKWPVHLEKMYGFWNTVLFFKREYKGNPLHKHIGLPINDHHFNRWVKLFKETLNENFEGEVTEDMKKRADNMGQMFIAKLAYINENPGFYSIG